MATIIQYIVFKINWTPGVDIGPCLQNDGSWGSVSVDPKTFLTEESMITYIDGNLPTGQYRIMTQVLKS